MAEARRSEDEQDVPQQQSRSGNVRRTVSEGANLVPFVGGVKMMGEAVAGKDMAGNELHGTDRVVHGVLGAGSLALDFTGIGEAEKAAVALERGAVGVAKAGAHEELAVAESGLRRPTPSDSKHPTAYARERLRRQIRERGREEDGNKRGPTPEHARRRDFNGVEGTPYAGAVGSGANQRGPTAGSRPEPTPEEERERSKRRTEERGKKRTASAGAARHNTAREQQYGENDALRGHNTEGDPAIAARILNNAIRDTFQTIDDEFQKKGEKFNTEDVQKIVHESPPPAKFPYFMVGMAITKDILDLLDFTGVGIIVASLLGILISMVLAFWSWHKMGGWWWKKMIISWFWKRFFLDVLIDITPGLQLIPSTTILVLMTHYREKKVVKLLNMALDKMHENGILKYIT